MKKVKIMLMSALVIAAVGGALAFKASIYSPGWYCGTTIECCPNANEHYLTTVGASELNRVAGIYCTNQQGSKNCTYVTLED